MTEYECKICGSIVYTIGGAMLHRLRMHDELMAESDVRVYYNELEWSEPVE